VPDKDQDEYERAVAFRPYTEKHKVRRTKDVMRAIFALQSIRAKIDLTLTKLQSGDVLNEKDANILLNINIPGVSKIIRPHCVEWHWKVRNNAARKILADDQKMKKMTWLPKTAIRQTSTSLAKVEGAKAFLSVFTKEDKASYSWGIHSPSKAWYEHFESIYHTNTETE